jgi:lysozyme
MTDRRFSRRAALGGLAALTLTTACAPRRPTTARIVTPPGLSPITPPNFSDSKPFDWPARSPAAYSVHGIDLSRWQAEVDWSTARENGVSFAFIKATEGGDMFDPRFFDHWQGAGRAGVARGAYHFYYFCTPAADQARWFISHVPRAAGALPPVLDLEWNHLSPTCTIRPPADVVRREARIWMDMVHRHYGQRPIIYTTPDFWERNDVSDWGEEVWLRAVAGHPSQVYPGARWTFWQYSGTGRIPGIRGNVDLNAFAGTPAQWSAWRGSRMLT